MKCLVDFSTLDKAQPWDIDLLSTVDLPPASSSPAPLLTYSSQQGDELSHSSTAEPIPQDSPQEEQEAASTDVASNAFDYCSRDGTLEAPEQQQQQQQPQTPVSLSSQPTRGRDRDPIGRRLPTVYDYDDATAAAVSTPAKKRIGEKAAVSPAVKKIEQPKKEKMKDHNNTLIAQPDSVSDPQSSTHSPTNSPPPSVVVDSVKDNHHEDEEMELDARTVQTVQTFTSGVESVAWKKHVATTRRSRQPLTSSLARRPAAIAAVAASVVPSKTTNTPTTTTKTTTTTTTAAAAPAEIVVVMVTEETTPTAHAAVTTLADKEPPASPVVVEEPSPLVAAATDDDEMVRMEHPLARVEETNHKEDHQHKHEHASNYHDDNDDDKKDAKEVAQRMMDVEKEPEVPATPNDQAVQPMVLYPEEPPCRPRCQASLQQKDDEDEEELAPQFEVSSIVMTHDELDEDVSCIVSHADFVDDYSKNGGPSPRKSSSGRRSGGGDGGGGASDPPGLTSSMAYKRIFLYNGSHVDAVIVESADDRTVDWYAPSEASASQAGGGGSILTNQQPLLPPSVLDLYAPSSSSVVTNGGGGGGVSVMSGTSRPSPQAAMNQTTAAASKAQGAVAAVSAMESSNGSKNEIIHCDDDATDHHHVVVKDAAVVPPCAASTSSSSSGGSRRQLNVTQETEDATTSGESEGEKVISSQSSDPAAARVEGECHDVGTAQCRDGGEPSKVSPSTSGQAMDDDEDDDDEMDDQATLDTLLDEIVRDDESEAMQEVDCILDEIVQDDNESQVEQGIVATADEASVSELHSTISPSTVVEEPDSDMNEVKISSEAAAEQTRAESLQEHPDDEQAIKPAEALKDNEGLCDAADKAPSEPQQSPVVEDATTATEGNADDPFHTHTAAGGSDVIDTARDEPLQSPVVEDHVNRSEEIDEIPVAVSFEDIKDGLEHLEPVTSVNDSGELENYRGADVVGNIEEKTQMQLASDDVVMAKEPVHGDNAVSKQPTHAVDNSADTLNIYALSHSTENSSKEEEQVHADPFGNHAPPTVAAGVDALECQSKAKVSDSVERVGIIKEDDSENSVKEIRTSPDDQAMDEDEKNETTSVDRLKNTVDARNEAEVSIEAVVTIVEDRVDNELKSLAAVVVTDNIDSHVKELETLQEFQTVEEEEKDTESHSKFERTHVDPAVKSIEAPKENKECSEEVSMGDAIVREKTLDVVRSAGEEEEEDSLPHPKAAAESSASESEMHEHSHEDRTTLELAALSALECESETHEEKNTDSIEPEDVILNTSINACGNADRVSSEDIKATDVPADQDELKSMMVSPETDDGAIDIMLSETLGKVEGAHNIPEEILSRSVKDHASVGPLSSDSQEDPESCSEEDALGDTAEEPINADMAIHEKEEPAVDAHAMVNEDEVGSLPYNGSSSDGKSSESRMSSSDSSDGQSCESNMHQTPQNDRTQTEAVAADADLLERGTSTPTAAPDCGIIDIVSSEDIRETDTSGEQGELEPSNLVPEPENCVSDVEHLEALANDAVDNDSANFDPNSGVVVDEAEFPEEQVASGEAIFAEEPIHVHEAASDKEATADYYHAKTEEDEVDTVRSYERRAEVSATESDMEENSHEDRTPTQMDTISALKCESDTDEEKTSHLVEAELTVNAGINGSGVVHVASLEQEESEPIIVAPEHDIGDRNIEVQESSPEIEVQDVKEELDTHSDKDHATYDPPSKIDDVGIHNTCGGIDDDSGKPALDHPPLPSDQADCIGAKDHEHASNEEIKIALSTTTDTTSAIDQFMAQTTIGQVDSLSSESSDNDDSSTDSCVPGCDNTVKLEPDEGPSAQQKSMEDTELAFEQRQTNDEGPDELLTKGDSVAETEQVANASKSENCTSRSLVVHKAQRPWLWVKIAAVLGLLTVFVPISGIFGTIEFKDHLTPYLKLKELIHVPKTAKTWAQAMINFLENPQIPASWIKNDSFIYQTICVTDTDNGKFTEMETAPVRLDDLKLDHATVTLVRQLPLKVSRK